MCYSAQVTAAYTRFVKEFGAIVDIHGFVELYARREHFPGTRLPAGMDAAFTHPHTAEERTIQALIRKHDAEQASKLEQELFKQAKRLADAERSLAGKPTKKALEDQRIARNKIAWAKGKLADLKRTTPDAKDSRIFPGWYAPVMIWEDGRRVVRPMRYQCRPAHVPATFDVQRPNAYNARRDNLEGFWKNEFGHNHGIMVVTAFYENVSRHRLEGRELAPGEPEENVILEFRPRTGQDMLVACLWSHWQGPGEDLWSFAAITDEPPPEIAAAGHDRVIIPIKPENIDAWLNPDPANVAASYAILDDRDRPYYEHRMAA